LLAGLLLPAPQVDAGEPPLTLAEAQRRAGEQSRQLVAQDAAISASRESAVAAGQLPDPVLRLGIDNLPIDGPDQFSLTRDFMTMRRIGIMQELTGGEKRKYRAERFEREAERGSAEKTLILANIHRDTALAWLDRYYAEAMATAVAEQIQESRLEIEAAEGAYRGGRGSQADVLTARTVLVTLEDRASELGRRSRIAVAALARWIGAGAGAPLTGAPALDTIRLDPNALDSQLAHHPQIFVMAQQEEVAAAEARLAQANRSSDWSVEASYAQRGPAYSNMVSVGVSIPWQWDRGKRQDRELASKLALVEQAKARREDALRAHVAEARAMIHEWENGRSRQVRYREELIPLARDRTQAVLAAYRGSKANLADVLAARRNELEVRLQALQLEMETARWWAQLNFLVPQEMPAHDTGAAQRGNLAKGPL
jgi:outer membrane protein TolC